ncbi:ABC transporter substrate-binding protein [Nocardiopsis sp. EMB25]|uniref:ABC transporter substrate-binding protein n=1 Tax=Nocardiopsis sp. EMB25 TaxID=2835867 RepID=UPI00228341A3|nr:ABC transporter substrate-binding protein [Nocardiopsis sp. EMB25]MCY9782994.1 ABC transporter substrate-binding protein [Nocardiopsis sp. EMB25]
MASKKLLGLTAATAALVLGISACGNGGESEGGEGGGGEAFTFGILYPQTGNLAFLGPPQITAAEYAISEINGAGGILGTEVPTIIEGDEAGDNAQANQAANNLVADEVNAVIGAAASGMTQATYDTITSANIVQCSGSNTSAALSDIDDNGYYFRTAPSDSLSAVVMARKIVEAGNQSVAVVARGDDYGAGYAQNLEAELEALGAEITVSETYDPEATTFDSVVSSVNDSEPDAVALIAFEEGAQVIAQLLESGVEGEQLFITDGLNDPELGEKVNQDDPDAINGVTGVAPSADNAEFSEGLTEFNPELEVFQFAPQVFDCVTVIALAAEAAGSVDPADYVAELPNVSRPEGTECGSFGECAELIADGEDINYQGVSGNIDFDDNGDPTAATFEIFAFGDDGHEVLAYEEHSLND